MLTPPTPISRLPLPITSSPQSCLTVQTSHKEFATSQHTLTLPTSAHHKQSHLVSEGENESLSSLDEYPTTFDRYVPLGTTTTAPRFRYGRYRFPETIRKRIVPQIFHDPALEIHRPAPLQPSEFMQRWKGSPIHFDDHQITHISHEPMHHGIMFLIDIADYVWPIGHPVQRGMQVEIRGYHKDELRYMLTWRLPCPERDAIYVQVNAYLEDGRTAEFYDIDWPALRLRIPLTPETHVDIPYPPTIVEHWNRQQNELDNQELVDRALQDSLQTGQGSIFQPLLKFCSSCTDSGNPAYP